MMLRMFHDGTDYPFLRTSSWLAGYLVESMLSSVKSTSLVDEALINFHYRAHRLHVCSPVKSSDLR